MRSAQCAVDGARPPRKMASVYWSYRPDGGERSAWKQFYCVEHFGPIHATLKRCQDGDDTCFRDGQTTLADDALHILWMTVYPPGGERVDGYVQVCDDCLKPALAEARQHSVLLRDRDEYGRGKQLGDDDDPWAIYK